MQTRITHLSQRRNSLNRRIYLHTNICRKIRVGNVTENSQRKVNLKLMESWKSKVRFIKSSFLLYALVQYSIPLLVLHSSGEGVSSQCNSLKIIYCRPEYFTIELTGWVETFRYSMRHESTWLILFQTQLCSWLLLPDMSHQKKERGKSSE